MQFAVLAINSLKEVMLIFTALFSKAFEFKISKKSFRGY